MRALTTMEKFAVEHVANRLDAASRVRLLEDLSHATAHSALPDGARVVFDIAGYQRPPYKGQRSFGVTGELLDRDGAKLSFDLYCDENGRLLELELIRWQGGDILEPDWSTLNLF